MHGASLPRPFGIACARPFLVASFARPHRMAGWSVNRPGLVTADRVAWLEVANEELVGIADPSAWFGRRLEENGLADAVGLMTARNVARHEHAQATVEGIRADCLITLGLNNGEAVGSRAGAHRHHLDAGTINILCAVSAPLSDAALLEMASLVTQARTVALLDLGYRRPGIDHIVTGTGTDCIVTAAPVAEEKENFAGQSFAGQSFAGMHTAVGEAVGRCVLEATAAAAAAWLAER